MATTLRDVALLAGVSVRTASNVVTGHPHVSDGVRERVLAAVEVLQYRPDVVARVLRAGSGRLVPLYAPTGEPRTADPLLDALASAALDLGLRRDAPAASLTAVPVCLLVARDESHRTGAP